MEELRQQNKIMRDKIFELVRGGTHAPMVAGASARARALTLGGTHV